MLSLNCLKQLNKQIFCKKSLLKKSLINMEGILKKGQLKYEGR